MSFKKSGNSSFVQFNGPASVDPLLFSQLCVYHYTEVRKIQSVRYMNRGRSAWSLSPPIQLVKLCLKKSQKVNSTSDGYLGTAVIGKNPQLICLSGNSTMTVPGQTSKLKHQKEPVLVEQARHHNLPNGISINSCHANPKNRIIPIILMNACTENIWI